MVTKYKRDSQGRFTSIKHRPRNRLATNALALLLGSAIGVAIVFGLYLLS